MTGVMFADYFLVREGRVRVSHLYNCSPNSVYWYSRGTNMRALTAWVMGSWLTLPGFVNFVQRGTEYPLPGWSNLYYISYLLGTAVPVVVYMALHYCWPMRAVGEVDDVEYSGTYEAERGGRVLDGEEIGSTEVVPIKEKEKQSQA
ncbi:permease for cytosine/purines, uracil, thiamine, allantoin-domain-containing protein [Aspergillus germanicus]